MPNQIITPAQDGGFNITVHGRGSLYIPYNVTDEAEDGSVVTVDISDRVMYFEVDGPPIRNLMIPNPKDPKGKVIVLTGAQVESLKKTPCPFTIRDETDGDDDLSIAIEEGRISRRAYIKAPDLVEDQ